MEYIYRYFVVPACFILPFVSVGIFVWALVEHFEARTTREEVAPPCASKACPEDRVPARVGGRCVCAVPYIQVHSAN